MGDPVGACTNVKDVLKPDDTCMIVEPFANKSLKENLNPVGTTFYSFSVMLCAPCSLDREVGLALDAKEEKKD